MSSSRRLEGRRILITGGASGIGRATAQLFHEEGARVAIIDRHGEAAEAAARECDGVSAAADVTDSAAVRKAVEHVAAALGGLDGLVNNAGIYIPETASEGNVDAWTTTLAVNLIGPMAVTAAALPFLKQAPGGTIVNVSSGIGLRPIVSHGAYAASKAGLLAWTKVLAQELAPNIRVNATCPGPTDTPLMRANTPDGTMNGLGAGRALARPGEPREQAQAILFLTGPESTFITGVTVPVDGGRAYH